MGKLNFKDEIGKLNPVAHKIVTIALIGLLLASLACLVEDYSTSYHGISLVPGQLVNDWIRFLLAATPSLLQVVFAFVAITQRNKLAAGITAAAWLFDFGTDMAYKMQGVEATPVNVIVVTVYALFIVSFFSEFMLMFSLQHLWFAVAPAWHAWRAEREKARKASAKKSSAPQAGGLFDDMQDMLYPSESLENAYNRASGRGK